MSRSKSTRQSRGSTTESDSGLVSPGDLWGKPLPFRPLYDAALPFDERVARAWEHIKNTRFTFEEHEQLREVLAGIIVEEARNAYPLSSEDRRGMSNGENEETGA